jgi:ABC-2 type transport system permease protein
MREWINTVIELIRIDLLQFFRNRMVVVSTMLTSVSMVIAFGVGMNRAPGFDNYPGSYFDFIYPGILAMGVMFSCTYTIGYTFIVDRHRRTIEDIVLSPTSYLGFLLGRIFGMTVKSSLQFILVVITGTLIFDIPIRHPLLMLYTFLVSAIFFGGLGIIVATVTNEISFAGLINLALIPLTQFGGIFFPLDNFGPLGGLTGCMPLAAHVKAFRCALGKAPHDSLLPNVVIGIYAILILTAAVLKFKRHVEKSL